MSNITTTDTCSLKILSNYAQATISDDGEVVFMTIQELARILDLPVKQALKWLETVGYE